MIEFKNVSKKYQDNTILKDITFEIEKGEIAVLIGSSGCGKTTTMKMINRMIDPSGGIVLVNSRDVQELDPITLRLGVGYVTQKSGLIPHMTIGENVALVPSLLGWSKKKKEARTRELLELINLAPDEYMQKMPSQLSGGQQQRVSIARALATEPDLILMDEPFSALDPLTRLQLQNEVKSLQSRLKKTIVIVSHDMNEALRLGDKIIFMDGGEIVQIGTPREFLTNPVSEKIKNFFSNASFLRNSDLIISGDIALKDYPKVLETSLLKEASEIFDTSEEEFVLVVDTKEQYKGYITARELAKHPLNTPIHTLPLRKKNGVFETTPSEELIRLFQTNKYLQFVPIETDEGKLVGIMTRSGLIDYIVTTIEKERQSDNV